MRDEQRKVVSKALEMLPNDLITKVIEENYFITKVSDREGKSYVIVDFTMEMDMNYNQFVEKSQRLYEEFALIPKWYEC